MLPTTGSIVLAPYTDDALYQEQLAKMQFWENKDFFGVDLTVSLRVYKVFFLFC